ncbi:hypothetical protein BX600DRAFT_471585 [Xylariales sp. PMI_506]|nr:hypothetical protein BX600DRAFT_471585 [Xylariales sp. PMI_506]
MILLGFSYVHVCHGQTVIPRVFSSLLFRPFHSVVGVCYTASPLQPPRKMVWVISYMYYELSSVLSGDSRAKTDIYFLLAACLVPHAITLVYTRIKSYNDSFYLTRSAANISLCLLWILLCLQWMKPTAYQSLSLDMCDLVTENPRELKRHFYRMAKTLHPDKNGGNSILYEQAQTAYAILSDPLARWVYDRSGVMREDENALGSDPNIFSNASSREEYVNIALGLNSMIGLAVFCGLRLLKLFRFKLGGKFYAPIIALLILEVTLLVVPKETVCTIKSQVLPASWDILPFQFMDILRRLALYAYLMMFSSSLGHRHYDKQQ